MGSDAVPRGSSQLTGAAPIWRPSPNFGPRRDGLRPAFVILHYTAMSDAAAALERLCDPDTEVSAHYLIGRDGACWQMVDEARRAWHAGAGSWRGLQDMNSRSIGIELDNTGTEPFSEPLMARLELLLRDMLARWQIAPAAVIGHSDMAPGRKWDPGARFDWPRLARQGLAAPTPAPIAPTADIDTALQTGGYTAQASPDDRLAAFRLRHVPGANGPPSRHERGVIAALARAPAPDTA